MTIEDQVSFLAGLIRDDTGMNEEKAKTWAKSHIDFVKAIKDGRASVKTRVDQPSAKYWTNNTFFTMRPTIIFGPQGQGKSFFCSWITLRALVENPDWDFYTNVPFFWFDYPDELPDAYLPNVHLVRNMKEMLEGIIHSRRSGRSPAIILDEMDAEIDSYSWQSDESRSWRIFTQFQRHFYVKGPILVYHYAKHIPSYLRNGGMARVVLLTYHDSKRYVLARFTRPYKLVVKGFAPPYASHGSYPFEVNIDMRYLYRKLEGVNPQRILDRMEESLEESIITDEKVEKKFREIEEAKTKEERDKKVIPLSATGLSQPKIAETLHMSLRDVSKILKEYHLSENGNVGNEDGNADNPDLDKEN
ncbi:MAG: hypothetical protein M1161_00175 [Candidatus Thermoplasmatota archaeon]|jgi:hypothetical protein|nr:hypothetical protein [Candidatus Thermoplasmatota archaeon]